jgi:hypothetical protein
MGADSKTFYRMPTRIGSGREFAVQLFRLQDRLAVSDADPPEVSLPIQEATH